MMIKSYSIEGLTNRSEKRYLCFERSETRVNNEEKAFEEKNKCGNRGFKSESYVYFKK